MSTERSLWEMIVSRFKRIKQERVERKRRTVTEYMVQQDFRHLLRLPVNDYQALIDQVMNHDPYDTPVLQKGKLVNVREEERKYLDS